MLECLYPRFYLTEETLRFYSELNSTGPVLQKIRRKKMCLALKVVRGEYSHGKGVFFP